MSKVFLLGAVPLAVLMVLRSRRGRIRVAMWTAAAVVVAWLLGHSGILPAWPAAASLQGFLHPAGGLVAQYTANRYSTGGTLGPVVRDVMHSSPWYGFGAGGLGAPYDSLWVEILVLGGIAGLILAAAVIVMLGYRWIVLRTTLAAPEWAICGAVLALAVGASFGLPSLTANRASTLLWLILGMLTASRPERGRCMRSLPIEYRIAAASMRATLAAAAREHRRGCES